MKIMFSVGEVSGDVHGAYLIRTLKKYNSNLYFFGLGGERMEEEGLNLIANVTKFSTVGFVEPLPYIPIFLKLLNNLERVLEKEKPDLLILIDFQGFNIPLAKRAKKLGIPTIYYFAPQYWLWGKRENAYEVSKYLNWIISVFPQEYEVYRKYTHKVSFFGHPLVDYISQLETQKREDYLIGLFPGSRKQEINKLTPLFVKIATHFSKRGFKFLLPIASEQFLPLVKKYLDDSLNIELLSGKESYKVLQRVNFALASSGTVTLEASLLYCPLFVFYKISKLTYYIGKKLVHHKYISLPNILSGKEIYPEYVQKINIDKVISDIEDFINNSKRREEMLLDLKKVVSSLGEKGVLDRIANFILSRSYV
ncbi:MAG: lipid-A-disaccharide synthase [Dictyoglomus sp.]|nr:lipid-A-disaccharide synthase [Dictyoglomus sp.]MCX7942810.1 lipid-A-disaccharide synthase [Dictyoglomaceae bacterium]MDW8188382.1 lipid-A-disaccharide synthase [Dictyoglomus sp.]